ncbi:AraC family transcriptional regulator [[Pseudomonas] boreopolis]|uniref:Transcriptional regulator n=1 Tax=Xanthomonas boreopolis TaxID=86183 RepID=A0A919KJ61_9XANT|nr:transcriptional regulator [[Pseudomonas] boreopolis]
MTGALQLRRYGRDGHLHHHAHVQVVLPLRGTLEIEVGGRGGLVDAGQAVVVAPGTEHDQGADGDNRFLLVECDLGSFGEARMQQLQQRPFVAMTPRLRALAGFVDRQCRERDEVPLPLVRHCLPQLLHALGSDPAPLRRLQALCDALAAAPGEAWPVERMARHAGLSESRLHALFRREFDRSPQQWLSALRLQRACAQLAGSDRPIAQLALDNGWSDQTALTRALRRETGLTPAAYRRLHRVAGKPAEPLAAP